MQSSVAEAEAYAFVIQALAEAEVRVVASLGKPQSVRRTAVTAKNQPILMESDCNRPAAGPG